MENEVTLKIKNATCPSCAKKIINALEKDYGNDIDASFDITTHEVLIDYNDRHKTEDFIKTIFNVGYIAEEIED